MAHYKSRGEEVIEDDLDGTQYGVIRASLISDSKTEKQKGDDLIRSLIRHDSVKLSKILYYKVIKKRWFDLNPAKLVRA